MDKLTPEQRSKNMQAVHSRNTKEEVRLAKTLWNLSYRYRKNNKTVFGKLDFTFKISKLDNSPFLEQPYQKELRFLKFKILKTVNLLC